MLHMGFSHGASALSKMVTKLHEGKLWLLRETLGRFRGPAAALTTPSTSARQVQSAAAGRGNRAAEEVARHMKFRCGCRGKPAIM